MKEKKKNLKGMTLAEIVVAMAVLLIVAVMLVIGCESAVKNARISKKVSDKTAVQAPYAATRCVETSDGTMKINLKVDGKNCSIDVDTYSVKEGETDKDRSGNYKYFVYPEPVVTTGP